MAQNDVIGSIAEEIHALTEAIAGDGGSGGGGGGEGGGSGVMMVVASIDAQGYSFDKTYEEIREAIQAGQLVYVKHDRQYYYFSTWYPEDEYLNHFYYEFRSLGGGLSYEYFTLKDDDTVTYDDFTAAHEPMQVGFTYEDGEWSCDTPFSDVYDSMYDILNGSMKLYGDIAIDLGDDAYFAGFGVTPWSASYTEVKFLFQFMSDDGATIYNGWCSLSEGDNDGVVSGAISTISATPLT